MVDDCGAADDFLVGVVEFDVDGVVGFFLPVFMAKGSGGGAVFVWGWEDFFQLAEFIDGAFFVLGGEGEQKALRRTLRRMIYASMPDTSCPTTFCTAP